MTEFSSEDEIFDLLKNKEKDAVYLLFYIPGLINDMWFYNTFEKQSANPDFKDI